MDSSTAEPANTVYTRAEFAAAVLQGIGAPASPENMTVLLAQMRQEGTSAAYNPLATTQDAPGATNFNSVGVKNYPDFQTGVNATVQTLQNGYYNNLISGLRAGNKSAEDIVSSSIGDLNTWGSGGDAVLSLLANTRVGLSDFGNIELGTSGTGVSVGNGGDIQPTGFIPGIPDALDPTSILDPLGIFGGAVGGVFSWDKIIPAIKGITNVAGYSIKALKFLTDPHSWVRVGMVLGGLAFIIVGLNLLKLDLFANATKLVGKVTAAA